MSEKKTGKQTKELVLDIALVIAMLGAAALLGEVAFS